jgi:lipoprotein-releasing system permease protein
MRRPVPFDLFVAVRFLREGRMQTLLIFVGVAFGVAVMVFVGALITGLQATLIKQTLSAQAHVVVRPPEEQARDVSDRTAEPVAARLEKSTQRTQSIDPWRVAKDIIDRVPGVRASAPTVAGSAFVSKGSVSRSVALRGIDPETYVRVIPIDEKMKAGAFRLVGNEAVIGVELARDLSLAVGDKVRVVSTEQRDDVFTVSGVFDLGNKDVNQRWVFVSMRSAQTMLDLPGRASTLEVKVDDVFEAERIAGQISDRTGLTADSWMKLNAQLLVGLRSQSSSSYMIQFFVMLAVALGIASVLVVSVVQKSKEIGILKATGTTTRRITRIFLIQGAIVGFVGSLLGSGIGTALSLLFANLAKNPDGSATFPVDLGPERFLLAVSVAVIIGLIAAVAPARRAAGLDPAKVIRYG